MGAKVCCHHEPDIDGIVPTPLNPEEDGLWKKLSDMKQWKAKMDNPDGPLRADLLKQGNYTALQDMSTDATKIGELIAKSEPLLAEALQMWPKRDWPNIKKTEAKFKFIFFEASEIWKKYVPTPDGGGSQVAPGPAQPAPAVPPQQPQGGPPNQPPIPIQPAAIQPQQSTSIIQGEQNYVQPGAMGEGGPPRPPPPNAGGVPHSQPPPAQPAYANPSYNPAPNAYQAPPPQQPNPYPANPAPTYQPSPQNQPPAHPAPPPQSQPVQPLQPPPQQQLVLPDDMQKAARVFKMAGEMPAKTELRKIGKEDQFEEMVAIMNNNLEAYNTAKNKRLSAPPPSPRKPPQRAAPPPAFQPQAHNPPPHMQPVTAPPHQPPPTQNVGAPQVGPPMGAPGGAPPRRPKPAMSFQDQIAARSKKLNNAKARTPVNATIEENAEIPVRGRGKSMNSSLIDNVNHMSVADIRANSFLTDDVSARPKEVNDEEWDD